MRFYRRLLHISYKDHITNEIVCTQIQSAIGPYEDLLTTMKKGSYDGSDTWPDQVASAKWSYKALYQGKERGDDKIKDAKTTSKSGPVSTSTAVREQPRTVRDGRRSSPMSAVVLLRPWWFRFHGLSVYPVWVCTGQSSHSERASAEWQSSAVTP